MPTMAAVSEEEYLRTSFPGVDREYRDGEILERSMPTYNHGTSQGFLFSFFVPHRKTHRVFPTVETRLHLRPGRFIIPDVCVFWPDEPASDIPGFRPLIVVEIMSPDDRLSEVRDKLREYFDWGVAHIWLIDPGSRVLYVFRHDGLHEVASYQIREVALEVTPSDIFG